MGREVPGRVGYPIGEAEGRLIDGLVVGAVEGERVEGIIELWMVG